MTNLFTPDRELNPPDHPEPVYKSCEDCRGSGYLMKIKDDGLPPNQPILCDECNGEGKILLDD